MRPPLWRVMLAVVFLGTDVTSAGVAQQTLEAASGRVGILEKDASTISLDLNDSRFSALFVTSPELKTVRWQFDASFAVALTQGARDIFAKRAFAAEFSAAARASLIIERSGAGYHSFFLAPRVSMAPRKTLQVLDSAAALLDRRTETGRLAGIAGGYNFAFTEDVILGLAGSAEREWNVPEASRAKRVCVEELSGVDDRQRAVTASDCDDRFVGPIREHRNSGQVRLDFTAKVVKPSSGPALGILVSSSASFADGTDPQYALATGPILHPFGKPSTIAGALLLEVADVTNTTASDFGDRFFARLYVGVPFDVLK